MSDDLKPAIDRLERQRAQQIEDVAKTEHAINTLCKLSGFPERYADRSADARPAITSIKADTFYGRPLATVVREYLGMRRSAELGPATVNEIFSALGSGGYQFDTKNEENAKRVLRISLTKNPIFHRLPNGSYGLSEWYPAAKSSKKAGAEAEQDEPSDADLPTPEELASMKVITDPEQIRETLSQSFKRGAPASKAKGG